MKVSVIIPVYNEEKVIRKCLESLNMQSYQNLEVIVVDDGSNDKTSEILSKFEASNLRLKALKQSHRGPGLARNLGAEEASGEILVFVDADMTFDKRFIEKLIGPMVKDQVVGTFSKDEYVENADNVWSKCWNLNKGLPSDKMHPKNYPDKQRVFRAIRKKYFQQSGGFKPIGYVDDYTVSEALGVLAVNAPGAVFYHHNPDSLAEVFRQARWIGKSEYKRRKIPNESVMRIISLMRYFFVISLIKGLILSVRYQTPQLVVFKIVYDLAVEVSLLSSLIGEQPY